MVTVSATNRERFALYLVLNPMQHTNRQERKRADRIFDALELGGISDTVDTLGGNVSHLSFDPSTPKEYELTSEQRDLLISLLDRPGVNTGTGRLLGRLEAELIKSRDGEVPK